MLWGVVGEMAPKIGAHVRGAPERAGDPAGRGHTANVLVEEAVPSELPLVEAKFAQPRIRAGVIPRARLFLVLDRLERVELTVVSGPAGAGKTVQRLGLIGGSVAISVRGDPVARPPAAAVIATSAVNERPEQGVRAGR